MREGPSRNVPGGHRAFFFVNRCCPLCGEGLRIYGHVDPEILAWVRGGVSGLIKPVGGEWWLLLMFFASGIRGLVMVKR